MDPGIPVFGDKGCSIHVQEIIRSMIKNGASIDLYTSRIDGNIPGGLEGVNIVKLLKAPKDDLEIREKLCIDTNIDLLQLLKNAKKYDFIYERYSLWSYSAIDYAKQNNIPSVLEINSPLIDEEKKYRKLINERAALNIAKKVFNNSSVLTVVSKPIMKYVNDFLDIDKKIYLVPNGVNTKTFKNPEKPNLNGIDNKFIVGFVGSLKKWHGVSMLIDSFEIFLKNNPKSVLLIVGDSKERKHLEERINSKGLADSIILTGSVQHCEIPGYLSIMDISVAPYLDQENFYFSPLKIYEYMAAGLPVLASDLKQIRTIIKDLENGKLFTPGDVNSLSENLQFLKDNPDICQRLGKEGRLSVENNSWDTIAKRIINIIANLN